MVTAMATGTTLAENAEAEKIQGPDRMPAGRENHLARRWGDLVRAGAIGLAAIVVAGAPAWAADWNITPSLAVGALLTDNVNLDETDEESEFLLTASPGITISGRGSRLTTNVFYAMRAAVRTQGTSGDELTNFLQASATGELLEDSLFLDLGASARPENRDSRGGRLTGSDLIGVDNLVDVITYRVSPYYQHRFSDFANALVRYQFSDTINNLDGEQVGDAQRHLATGSLTSGDSFRTLPWSLTYSYDEENNDDGTRSVFQNLRGRVSYRLNERLSADFSAGYEDDQGVDGNSTDGFLWSAGGTWSPSQRTRISAGFNHRQFDDSLFFRGTHRSRRVTFSASFSQELTTSTRLQQERVLVPLVDDFGDPITDPDTGQLLVIPIDTPTVSTEVFANTRLDGRVTYTGRRNSATLSVYSSKREFESDNEEDVYGWDASIRHTLSSRSSLVLNGGWQTTDATDGGDNTQWDVGLGLNYQLNDDLSINLRAAHQNASSDVSGNSFEENQVAMNARMNF